MELLLFNQPVIPKILTSYLSIDNVDNFKLNGLMFLIKEDTVPPTTFKIASLISGT